MIHTTTAPPRWTLQYKGGPIAIPSHFAADTRVPGQIIVRERPEENGVCDGFILTERMDALTLATYTWVASGTPDEVIKLIVDFLPPEMKPGA